MRAPRRAGDAADAFEGPAAEEDGAAGGGGAGVAGVVDLGEGVEELEEEDEGGDEGALGGAGAAELDHFGDHVEAAGFEFLHEGGEVPGVVEDVGVGEEEDGGGGSGDALLDGPELAAPAGGAGGAVDDGEAGVGDGAGDGGGGVGAAVVDEGDVEGAGVVLGEEGAEGGVDARGFVAGGDDDVEWGGLGGVCRGEGGGCGPEAAVEEEEVGPGNEGDGGEDDHGRRPSARNQVMASLKASRAGRAV